MNELGHGWGMGFGWLLVIVVIVWGVWVYARRRPPSE